MTEVQLEDGTVLEFPEGVSPEEIQEFVNAQYPPRTTVPANTIVSSERVGPTPANLQRQKLESMGPFRRALFGAERSLDEAAMGLKQATVGLSPQEEQELSARRGVEDQIPGSWLSRAVGDTVLYAAPASRTMRLAQVLRPGSVAAKYGAAAGTGAGIAALQPTLGNESRGVNALTGAITGTFGQGAGDTLSTLIRGMAPKNPAVARLPQSVQDKLSLGQSVDQSTIPGRFLATTEEKLTSVPMAGDAISSRRAGAVDSWRDDLIKRVSPKGFTPTGENTREKLGSAYGEYQKRYVQALRGQQIPPSRLFESQVLKITTDPRSGVPQDMRERVNRDVMEYYQSLFHGNSPATGPAGAGVVTMGGHRGSPVSVDAENAKAFEAFLSSKARQFRRAATTPGSAEMAKMYEDLERAWSVSYRRALPSSARVATKELDRGYAPYKTVERAAEYVGNDAGDFTPDQLVSAVKARTPGPRFARQEGILQQEAQDARSALKNRVPNSGTTDRAVTLGALAGLVTNPMETAATFGAILPATATKTGRDLVLGDTKTQKLLQRLRADRALSSAGLPAGITINDLMFDEDTLE